MAQLEDPATDTTSGEKSVDPGTHRSWLHRTFAGSYRIESVLGEGAMGQVLLAKDIHLERAVAIKVLKPDTAERIQNDQRFRREARVLSRLSHPNIVTLYAFGTLDDGTGYIVMERVNGVPLTPYCDPESLLPHETLGSVIDQICMALSAAHRQGIVHRDIKPTNVLVADVENGPPLVKVLDFGLAKPLDTDTDSSAAVDLLATSEGAAIGTPAYMSPEQACGEVVDGRADIYGLACLTTQLLTGHLPFGDLQGTQMVMAHVNQKPRLPSQLIRGPEFLPGGALDRVMACALSKKREERFADPMAFANAFKAALKGVHADGFDPLQTGPVTGAFQDTQHEADGGRGTAFGATHLAGVSHEEPQALVPYRQSAAVLHLELESLCVTTEEVPEALIGEALAIIEARVSGAITAEGGELLGSLVGTGKGYFSADLNPTRAVEAAVQAALAIRKVLEGLRSDPLLGDSFSPSFRLGIDLGDLYVGSNFRGDDIAYGPALAGARSMVLATQNGEIRVSKRCYRLARGRFHYLGAAGFESEVGPVVAGLISTYQPSETEIYGVPIPCIGRTRELERVSAVIDDAMDLMPGGRILIRGAQGVGKTRLVSEAVNSFNAERRVLMYEAGQCTLSGHNLPYRPFVQAIRSRAGIVHDDEATVVIDKIEAIVRLWLLRDGEEFADLGKLTKFLHTMLDVSQSRPSGDPSSIEEPDIAFVQEGFAAYYERILERAPVLMFIDDFMHASPQTQQLVHFLVQRFADDPYTTILCTRDDSPTKLSDCLALPGSADPIELHLAPLSEQDTQALVRAILHKAEDLSSALVTSIARLASGVPHIAVEAIYELIDSKVIRVEEERWFIDASAQETVHLPESAEQLFRDRVERLTAHQRDLVEIAAVAGDIFWPDLLAAMASSPIKQRDIEGLVARGFFKAKPNAMVDGAQGYGFSQLAMAESVYRNTPPDKRCAVHGSIANWLEALPEGAAHPDDALIGTHFRLGEMPQRALPYLVRGGGHALARGSFQEALRHLNHALVISDEAEDHELNHGERQKVTRAIGGDLMDGYVRCQQHEMALELAQKLLGPGGPLAGTDPSENCRILLGRANALANLVRHAEARIAYNSVFRLLGEDLENTSAIEARLGALVSTRHLDGLEIAREQLARVLAELDASVRGRADVAPLVSRIEDELRSMQAAAPTHNRLQPQRRN